MGRKTIRVKIPTNKPEEFSKLLNKINEQHVLLSDESPLLDDSDIDMTAYASKLKDADGLRSSSEKLRGQAESTMQSARQVYGTDKGQTINTPGTLLFTLDLIKKQLLKKFKNKEEELSKFGFQVVIGQSKSPTKKPL